VIDTAKLLRPTLGEHIEIDSTLYADCWHALIDPSQLSTALINLAVNARDAMAGGGKISFGTTNVSFQPDNPGPDGILGDFVLVTVVDNGAGIPATIRDRIFEPFFTTKELGKGSGLGLSMVYGFAKQSNGAFRLNSDLGVGTTAELWLPRAPDEGMTVERPVAEEASASPPATLRILLVDDHAEVRSTTAAVLADLGHEIVEAANGADALASLEAGECDFDLLISDYAMPHLSGTDFLRQARKLCPGVPALIITGYAEAEAIDGRPEGVEVLQKPFTQSKLESALSRVIAGDMLPVINGGAFSAARGRSATK
jgi:CheY-like chemotaxis protein